ncbi:MAG: M23 family metallopeptidase [Candidatus Levyibacteriota bacterium]
MQKRVLVFIMRFLPARRRYASSIAGGKAISSEFSSFLNFFASYLRKKIILYSVFFEKNKNVLVRLFMVKRGRYNRPFLHLAVIGVLIVGVISAPFLASTYPVFSSSASSKEIDSPAPNQSIIVGDNVFQTDISQKPRDETIIYTVARGDTISTIAQKFGISGDTIKWENSLSSDDIAVGDTLEILPVSGMSHKVSKGDTVYSIAKKYDTDAQKIVDFPFNEFANPETFSLVEGQILVVPDGIKPEEQPFIRRQQFIASGPVTITSGGFTWPFRGVVSQGPAWYHMALDILGSYGAPIVAAQSGTVSIVNVGTWDGGYGNNVYIAGDNGYTSHYAHMSGVNVSPGDKVVAGQTVIGWIGLTGRTTGAHLHFEILRDGVLLNPFSYLQ